MKLPFISKPLGIFYFFETIEDFKNLKIGNNSPLPDYKTVMGDILKLKSDSAKIVALENYWVSLLEVKNLQLIEDVVADVESNLSISKIAKKNNISR